MDTNEGQEAMKQLDALQEENLALRGKLKTLEKLEQDQMAEEIFEKAKKRFKNWLTVGGLAVLLAGALGFKSIEGYVKSLAEKKLEHFTDSMIEQKVQEHAKLRVEVLIENQKDQLIAIGRQQVVNIVARLPIATVQEVSTLQVVQASTTTSTLVDLTEFMTPIRDQGAEGSTVGFAVAAAMEGLWARKTNKMVVLSPRYLYNSARAAKNWKGDTGAYVKDAVQIVRTQGAVIESVWPYKPGEFDSKPPTSLEMADRFRAKAAREVMSLAEIKAALQNGSPVVGGITLYQSSMRDTSGIIPDPTSKDSIVGGHAICIVGFDDIKKMLKFKNSWGASWGKEGYGYISYSYAEENLKDAWVLEL